VGTSISLLPRVLDGNNVELSILINVSDIVGEKAIGNTRVPITSSRDFSGQAIVASGSTLAIGGLERVLVSRSQTQVPVLGSVPLLGLLFRREQSSDDRSKLLMFITPTLLTGYSGGAPSSPEIDAASRSADEQWPAERPMALK
jgi:type II secretory pathway component GspD/PulD (secretin)